MPPPKKKFPEFIEFGIDDVTEVYDAGTYNYVVIPALVDTKFESIGIIAGSSKKVCGSITSSGYGLESIFQVLIKGSPCKENIYIVSTKPNLSSAQDVTETFKSSSRYSTIQVIKVYVENIFEVW